MIKQEIRILFTAIMFYTRIPVPRWVGYSPQQLNKASRYFPFIGLLVGGIGACVFWGLNHWVNQDIAIIAALSAMVLTTGAFHEDALADVCDAFGGGYSKEQTLTIMKDSRVGTYAVVGLVLLFLSKLTLLSALTSNEVIILLLVAHIFSRFMPVVFIATSTHVGNFNNSKTKPIGEKSDIRTFVIAFIIGCAPLYLLPVKSLLFILPVQLVVFVYYRNFMHRKIGGYTGDVLGTLQQLSEVAVYLMFLIAKNSA